MLNVPVPRAGRPRSRRLTLSPSCQHAQEHDEMCVTTAMVMADSPTRSSFLRLPSWTECAESREEAEPSPFIPRLNGKRHVALIDGGTGVVSACVRHRAPQGSPQRTTPKKMLAPAPRRRYSAGGGAPAPRVP